MFSSSNNVDLFNKYKRQTYRLVFPFGMLITVLYVIIIAEKESAWFYLGISMAVILGVLTLLVWYRTHLINIIETIFYYVVTAFFFLLTQLSLNVMIANDILTPESLSDQLNSLGMWLILFMVAGFLTLTARQARLLILFIFICLLLMCLNNIRHLAFAGQLTPPYLFRWFNPLSCLAIATLLIQRMGVLQQNHASTDSLSGLMNRRALYQALGRELDRSARYKKVLSVVLFDLDHFKIINDTHGHIAGDNVLRGLSGLISGTIRQSDYLGRWGGEEFLLILPETDSGSAGTIAERICGMIRDSRFGNEKSYNITASFGVTAFQGNEGLDDILQRVDHALYQAKQKGRDQVVVV